MLLVGVKSICIGADGTGGCRAEQSSIYWQLDEKDQLHFVNYPHRSCGKCFRPCRMLGDDVLELLTTKELRQTSAVTASKMIQRRRNAGKPL